MLRNPSNSPQPQAPLNLHTLPKIELHAHLLGTVRKATFLDLCRKTKAPISTEEVEAFYTRGEKPVGVLRVLRALDEWLLTTPADFHRLTYEYLADAAAHNVHHAEFFWNPTGTAHISKLSYQAVLPAIEAAIADARKDLGISALTIPSIDREASCDAGLEMVQWIVDTPSDCVRGIGMDYRENDHPPQKFVAAYALAKKNGLKATAHAGEFGCPWVNVQTAMDVLQCDRIDHGYTIIDNPELIQQAIDRNVVFTVVPSNSYYLRTLHKDRWALDHPIREMLKLGLKLHPNTDDPTLHHINPSCAWQQMVDHFGASNEDIVRFTENGIDAAWVDESTKAGWRSEMAAYFESE